MNYRKRIVWFFLLLATWTLPAQAQDIQVSRENRTVAVSVTKTVEVSPEFASVEIGYSNRGREQSSVYEENGRQTEKVINALLAAGVKKEDIQTETLDLGPADESSREEGKEKESLFEATQTWTIRAPLGSVQKVVDHAVAAGANKVSEILWLVSDPNALDVKARQQAVVQAQQVAEEMAKSLGGKLGNLLYVSNEGASSAYLRSNAHFGSGKVQTIEVTSERLPILNLFPQKVRREVTVYAVFALE